MNFLGGITSTGTIIITYPLSPDMSFQHERHIYAPISSLLFHRTKFIININLVLNTNKHEIMCLAKMGSQG